MTYDLQFPPNRMREVRERKGMTLKQVGDALGATQTQIGRFETGERDPSWEWIRRIARALDVQPGELILEVEGGLPSSAEAIEVLKLLREGKPETVACLSAVISALGRL